MTGDSVRQIVKDHYGKAALQVLSGSGGCCSAEPSGPVCGDLYDSSERAEVPADAIAASLGCGNPTALAQLKPGDVVLDLGSGGGIDVLLSARRVGPAGKAFGLDMTEEMLTLAEQNKQRSGLRNVEFLRGEIEDIPLPGSSVDVIISNCVINLSADKDRVLSEAFRVLRPGGRFAVSDIVLRGPVPAEVRREAELWAGCVGGALEEAEYRGKLEAAGFTSIEVQPTRVYSYDDALAVVADEQGPDANRMAQQVTDKIMSAFIRAVKPSS